MPEEAFKTSKKVLIADDDALHCQIARRLLEADGHEVHEAHTGETALNLCETWHPDLLILDSMLPNKCGLECLYHIQHNPHMAKIRVVMCSARHDISYVISCMDAGAAGYMFKPYEAEKFCNRIRHLLHTV